MDLAGLAAKAAQAAERRCLSCQKLYKDEEPKTVWEPAVRTVRIDLPSTREKNGKMEGAAAVMEGEVCGICFNAIHSAPKGKNPGFRT